MRKYHWQEKLRTGEYISTWNGYIPFYAGCFYGSQLILGGEDKYSHCYDFFSGIGDVEWWIKEELDKLSQIEQDDLIKILKRNKQFEEYKNKLAPELAKLLNVNEYQIHRIPNKCLYEFLQQIDTNHNSPINSRRIIDF